MIAGRGVLFGVSVSCFLLRHVGRETKRVSFQNLPQQGLGFRGRGSTYAQQTVIYAHVMLLSLTMTRLRTKLHEVYEFSLTGNYDYLRKCFKGRFRSFNCHTYSWTLCRNSNFS